MTKEKKSVNSTYPKVAVQCLTAILFFFYMLSIRANGENQTYTSHQYYYSFNIPDGWYEIPKSAIDAMAQQASDMSGVQFIDYAAGFQLENTESFQHPYILIQQHKINTPSYSQIAQAFESDEFSAKINEDMENYSELMSNASFQNPLIDKERNIIFMSFELDVVIVGKVKGLIAMFLGKNGITQLNFYSVKSEYLENLSIFNHIIDSFEYKRGYEFIEEEAKKKDTSSIFNSLSKQAIIGTMIVLLIFVLISRSKNK